MKNTPDIRLICDIKTESVWRSSDHWMLLYDHAPEVIYSRHFNYEEALNSHPSDTRIYPFKYDHITGTVIAVPWHIADGEEVIESMNGYNQCSSIPDYYFDGEMCWVGIPEEDDGVFPIIPQRSGMRPAKRKGKGGIVWVWEPNKGDSGEAC